MKNNHQVPDAKPKANRAPPRPPRPTRAIGGSLSVIFRPVRSASLGCLGLLLLGVLPLRAADADDFLARVYTNAAHKTLLYRLLVPKDYDSKQIYPILLYLHGAAGRGHDNAEPLNWGPRLFLDPALRQRHRFFLLVPQCPDTESWVGSSMLGLKGPAEAEPLRMAIELMHDVLPKEFSIDPKRRYVTGVSMGGFAVWVTMARSPGFFAAAVPVCAGGSPQNVTDAGARYPVWAFHSDDDHLVPVSQARALVKAWREHGGTAKYTEYTGLKHSSWKKAYADPGMFDWLFAQHLGGEGEKLGK